ncbi:MAG: polysaccharide pyruvyl transferase family protein [Chloroflexota bacterium]|nr:polysaccharide pyruvyl transferase family protein [Chloroflexota bacterium]MDQ5864722.1 polysaccharide pyruvyl transferase family protein [Chloroflexota bacterium]
MRLFYYQDPDGNFGDDLNAWLWPRLIPELLDDDGSTLFVGIGSILDRRIPQGPRKIVFGTGVGYGLLPVLNEEWQVCCVRGPLSARALGLPPELAVTDSAALVRTLRRAPVERGHKVSFIPHFRTPARALEVGVDLEVVCTSAGINYIDPSGPVEDVLNAIESSGKIIAEAMHGAIVADALGVPWLPVRLSDRIRRIKWRDWCGSLGMEYSPLQFSPPSGAAPGEALARSLYEASTRHDPVLSSTRVLDEAVERLVARLELLKQGRVDECGVQGSARFAPDPEVLREVPWLYEMQAALKEVEGLVPLGATFILVDEERWGGGQALAGRRTLPFLERDGRYWGLPADSGTAIAELERLRNEGAQYIVFMWPSFWWLSYYHEFHSYLRQNYSTLSDNERILVFSL